MNIAVQIAAILGFLLPLVTLGLRSRRAAPALRPIRVPTRRR